MNVYGRTVPEARSLKTVPGQGTDCGLWKGKDEDPQSCLHQWVDGGDGQKLQILGVHISEDLSWTQHINAIIKTLLPENITEIRHVKEDSHELLQ